ncbi:MAG: hypothetical protein AABX34_05090 [Nanoarchaeota archaeon]
MSKVHTRVKRREGLTRRAKHYSYFHPAANKSRPKTFKTEATAKAWALSNGLKEGQYNLEKAKKGKKFKVVMNGQDKNGANQKNNA